jgi:AcrR family transcriptional regulator
MTRDQPNTTEPTVQIEESIFGVQGLPMVGQPRERADAAENRRRILAAAQVLANDRGASGLTMQAVATAAGVGKATVFHRFGDRDGLVRALLDDYMTELQDGFLHGPPPLGPGARADQRLEAFMSELVRCTVANLGAALIGESLTTSDPPPVYGALRLHVSLLIGEIDPGLPAGTLAAYLLNAVAPSVLDRSLSAGDADVTVLIDAARALVRGITGALSDS